MSRTQRITTLLQEAFHPLSLTVTDTSQGHAGHSGASPLGETHYSIHIHSPALSSLTRVEAHKKVYAVLNKEFDTGLHALELIVDRHHPQS
jgi:BolA family transcriptional regulator, general stress-responsive regulator